MEAASQNAEGDILQESNLLQLLLGDTEGDAAEDSEGDRRDSKQRRDAEARVATGTRTYRGLKNR